MPEFDSINKISDITDKQKPPMTCINKNAENELICQKKVSSHFLCREFPSVFDQFNPQL